MTRYIPDAKNHIWDEGQSIDLDLQRTSDTTLTLSWTLPATFKAYDGILLLLSTTEMNPSNHPVDGVKYKASSDILSPADRIGNAFVVGAFYGDRTTTSLDVSGLDPDGIYYCSAHLVTNVRQYYTYGVLSYPASQFTDGMSGTIQPSNEPPTDPYVGQVYFDLSTKYVLMWTGSIWQRVTMDSVATGVSYPQAPIQGEFFYDSKIRKLKIWNGTEWKDVQMQQEGLPPYSQYGVGTDGTYDERSSLIDILKKQLGWPVVCVELTEDHYNIAIDNALQELRRRADSAYTRRFFFMTVKPGQDIYYLNDPAFETSKVSSVIAIHRLSGLGYLSASGDNGLYAQQMIKDLFYPGFGTGQIDLVSVHLMASLAETFSQIFAGAIDFTYRENTKELRIMRRVYADERVLVEAMLEKSEQEILVDRWTTQWIQNWALSECREMLGMIRSKFGSLPGAAGGLSLNGDMLIQQANEEKIELLRQITDFEVGNGADIGNWSFVCG